MRSSVSDIEPSGPRLRRYFEHKVNDEGERHTNYYRLTKNGRVWAKRNMPELLEVFKTSRARTLELTREQLQNRGWFPYVFQSFFPNSRLEEKSYITLKGFRRGMKIMTYFKITKAGHRFGIRVLKRDHRRALDSLLTGISDRAHIKQIRAREAANLKQEIAGLDGYELVWLTHTGSHSLGPSMLA